MFQQIWAASGRRQIVTIHDGHVRHYDAAADSVETVAGQLDATGADVYFAPALFKPGSTSRTASSAQSCAALWADMDCGAGKPYPDAAAALRALVSWCAASGFPRVSHLVQSGAGLHAYWWLGVEIPAESWVRLAGALKARWQADGLLADPARTSDIASILRIPGTGNHKTDPAKPVRLLYAGAAVALAAVAAVLAPQLAAARAPAAAFDPLDRPNLPPGDAPAIARQCAQMRAVRDDYGQGISEPHWRAALSVLVRCNDGEQLVHDWSRGDPRYSARETTNKAAKTGGPATCGTFEAARPGGCDGCAMRGKVNSPIMLTVQQPTEHAAPWGESQHGMFTVGKTGVWMNPENGAAVRITTIPIWVADILQQTGEAGEQAGAFVDVRYIDEHGDMGKAALPQAVKGSPSEFAAWLGNTNLVDRVVNQKGLAMYLSTLNREILTQRKTTRFYSQMGWVMDGFVLGDTKITPSGVVPCVTRTNYSKANKLQAHGNLEMWTNAMNALGPNETMHKIALLMGFGTPLLDPARRGSSVISLVGDSGAGKTTAARLALSIYGDPSLMQEQGNATTNALETMMRAYSHVPVLFDEASTARAAVLQDFIYMAANGQGKGRSNRNLKVQDSETWALTAFVTSNNPLLEFDSAELNEATRRRVIEIPFSRAMDKELGERLNHTIRDHHGVAGKVFLDYLTKHRHKIPEMVQAAEAVVSKLGVIPQANRFGLWAVSAALVGGAIARSLNLIEWDIMEPIKAAVRILCGQALETRTGEQRVQDVIEEMLALRTINVSRWEIDSVCLNEPREPFARVAAGGVYIGQTILYAELRKQGVSRNSYKEWVAANPGMELKTIRLSPGAPPMRCHYFPDHLIRVGKQEF